MNALKTAWRWIMRTKWRRWGAVALLCLALNYTLLILEVIDANQFQTLTAALITFIRLFIG